MQKIKRTKKVLARVAQKDYFSSLKELKDYLTQNFHCCSDTLYYDYYKSEDEYILLIGYL